MNTRAPSSILAGAAILAAAHAIASDLPATLIDRDLREQRVTLQAISTTSLTYVDAHGLVRTEPAEAYLAVFAEATAEPSAAARLELVDRRRFPGLLAEPPDPDSIAWDHPTLGTLTFPLDEVRRIRLAPTRDVPADADNDLALLTNGDRLEGFVESIGTSLVMRVGDATITTPLDRVGLIALANPESAPSGARLWLADGSVLAVESFDSTRMGELVLTLAGDAPGSDSRARVESSSLRAAAWNIGALTPLADLAPARVEPIDRRWTRPPTALEAAPMAADLLIPGPMRAAWALPDGARRFACVARLPEDDRRWGDAELAISAGGAELARVRLNASAPEHAINVELPRGSRELLITLEPGAHGPVQDRVLLRRPLLAR